MSIQALTWVMEHSESKYGARLVAYSLANHADRQGRNAYPSIPTIARESRLSDTAVREGLRELLKLGEIVETGVGPRGTRVFCFPALAATLAAVPDAEEPAPAGVVREVVEILKGCPNLEVNEEAVASAMRVHQDKDPIAAAHTVASWAHAGGLAIRQANRLMFSAFEKQATTAALRDAEVERRGPRRRPESGGDAGKYDAAAGL